MPKDLHIGKLVDAAGVQHANDEYYYRPLIAGDNLFTYVAHVMPGGYMAPDAEEAEMFELSLYMLEGSMLVYYGEEEFTLEPNTALFIPRGVPFGVRNETETAVSFVLTFTPPPQLESIESWLARVPEHKRKTADQLRAMIGKSADSGF